MQYWISLDGELWGKKTPFMCPWDLGLIGKKLREEFAEYLEKYKEEQKIVTGGNKRVLEAEVLKSFMLRKKINLVDDPATNGLKSVFVLKVGEKKLVDEEAKRSLAKFEKRKIRSSDGTETSWLGFIIINAFASKNKTEQKEKEVLIRGKDVDYTEEEEKKAEESRIPTCPRCGKEFETKMQLNGHMISCKAKRP